MDFKNRDNVRRNSNTTEIGLKWDTGEAEYLSALVAFSKKHTDIKMIMICSNADIIDIIMVVDDTSKDEILSYNEFLFDMCDGYNEIHDFMIVDKSMLEAVSAMYETQRWIGYINREKFLGFILKLRMMIREYAYL